MIRVVTYDDWQIDFDPEFDKFYATTEEGIYECKMISVSNNTLHTDEELLNGNFVSEDFDFGGEFDKPDYDEDDNEYYQYGYWKIIQQIE